MPANKMIVSVLFATLLLLGYTSALMADDPATLMGTIDNISKTDSGIYVDVTIQGESAQPLNPELSTGTANPSQVMTPGGTTPSMQLAAGMPVKLIVMRQNAMFRFNLGAVDSVQDKRHCTVRVDPSALNQTFQDPVDQNNVHKAGEFFKVGATVAVWGVSPG